MTLENEIKEEVVKQYLNTYCKDITRECPKPFLVH
jgi:hypothetical protein